MLVLTEIQLQTAALILLSLIACPAVPSFRNKFLGEQTDLGFAFFFFFSILDKFPSVAFKHSVST